MIRIGIVGTGGMAADRISAFKRIEEVSVSGIYSRSPEKAAGLCASAGADVYGKYSDLLANCDAVVISTPNCTHSALASEALAAGKHVLVEYPLCTGIEEAESLREQAAGSAGVLMVGNTIIHEAMFEYLERNLDRLGEVVSASSRVAFYGPENSGRWYMNKELSGPRFATMHYHHIEYYKRFLGRVEWVAAEDQSVADELRPGYDKFAGGTLFMGHERGGRSSIQWYLSSSGSGSPRGFWMTGTLASVTITSQEAGRSQVVLDDGGAGRVENIEDDWGV
ncbi:MAG TPA: Gfo/Idh/MocA family oxidoreductase, partial [Armatimonadota bacterium]